MNINWRLQDDIDMYVQEIEDFVSVIKNIYDDEDIDFEKFDENTDIDLE